MPINRLALLNSELEKNRLEGLLVTNPVNVSYLSGFIGHDSVILIVHGDKYLFTDSRYIEIARKNVKGFKILLVQNSMTETLEDAFGSIKAKAIGFESLNLVYAAVEKIQSQISRIKFVPTTGIIETLRSVKDATEINLIRASIRLTKKILRAVSIMIEPGMTENRISRAIEIEFINNGAKSAYDTIVASGKNSSMPHARPGSRKIGKSDFVMVDLGCILNGYCSDITRMFTTGRLSDRYKRVWDVVRRAQAIAIKNIKPGLLAENLDFLARNYITESGFGKFFGHALGHGIGKEVHEAPSISRRSGGSLKSGMVFTVEPAIYVPGFGGVRIEDMVLVTDTGHEILT